jgi:hypothetical protein
MATEKQIAANRLNGLKGGVHTPEGKNVSRLNAISHGIFTQESILPGEDSAKLAKLRDKFMLELKPVGELETLMVERIISSSWRLKRVLYTEKKAVLPPLKIHDSAENFLRGIDYRYDNWQNYSKYENALETQIYKALHELERLQGARLGENLPPPCALDINVTGDLKNSQSPDLWRDDVTISGTQSQP